MARHRVKTMKLKGTMIDIEVDDSGKFWGQFGGEWYHDDTLKRVEQRLQNAAKVSTADVKIPFTGIVWGESDHDPTAIEVHEGVGVGIHAGNNNLLVRWAKDPDKTDQLRSYSIRDTYRFTKSERKTLVELTKAYAQAHKALKKFLESKEFSLRDALEAEIKKAAAVPQEGASAEGEVS